MSLYDAYVWFDLHQLLGGDFDPRRTKAYVTTNVENGTLIDTTTSEIRMGDQPVTINADGTGEFATWIPGADGNPTSWQTSLHVDYPRTGQRDRKTRTFGPYTIDHTVRTVTNKALTSNVATLDLSQPHGLRVGDTLVVYDVDATFNGSYTITATPTTSSLSYAKTAANVASTAATGTIRSAYVSLALLEDEQAIPPTYETTLTARLDAHEAALEADLTGFANTQVAAAQTARTGAETARAGAEAARDAAVDISNISTSDAVVEALVKNTGGAGPLTSAALSATYVSQAKRPISLRDADPTIDFTGATNDAGKIQVVLDSGGVGSTIEMGRPGILRADTGLTMYEHQTFIGGGTFTGAGGAPQSELRMGNLGSTSVGITGGGNTTLKFILLRGPANPAVGSQIGFKSTSGSPRFEGVGFYGWPIGDQVSNAYYSVFLNCEWSRNKYGHSGTNNYNLQLINPRMFCGYGAGDSIGGTGIDGGARGLNVFGGALEGYGAGGGVALYDADVANLFGTYFETAISGAFGVNASARNKVTLNAIGLMGYLHSHSRFFHLAGATNMVFNSRGNKWVCPETSATTPVIYYMNAADAQGAIRGQIAGDDTSEFVKTGALYTTAGVSAAGVKSLHILHPGRTYADGRLSTTAVLDFPSIAASGGTQELTVSLPGAAVGDHVALGPPAALNAGLVPFGRVTAADTVTVRLTNITAAAIDPSSASWRVTI